MQQHFQTGGKALQERPWEIGQAPWETEEDTQLKQVYEANEPLMCFPNGDRNNIGNMITIELHST
jgi:hypothetical protein